MPGRSHVSRITDPALRRAGLLVRLSLCALVLALPALACSGPDKSGIQQVTSQFYDAYNNNQPAVAYHLMGNTLLCDLPTFSRNLSRERASAGPATLNGVTQIQLNGDYASAIVLLSLGGQDGHEPMSYVKQNGAWRIKAGACIPPAFGQ